MRSQFGNVDYEPTHSIDPFERVAQEMVRTGNMANGDDSIGDFDDEDGRAVNEAYEYEGL